jgi:membrane protease YdiL (CAAX protease family)
MTPERKAGLILAGIAVAEGAWVALNFAHSRWRFVRYLGFARDTGANAPAWIAAAITAAVFVGLSIRLPSVRANLLRFSSLKILALAVAVAAGILEEVMFRKWLMDAIATRGGGVLAQIIASATVFGVLHGVWGLFGGSARAAAGATVVTSLLGGALAIVYVVGGRSLAPCIAAHFTINALLEPGLVLAATRREMGGRAERRSES